MAPREADVADAPQCLACRATCAGLAAAPIVNDPHRMPNLASRGSVAVCNSPTTCAPHEMIHEAAMMVAFFEHRRQREHQSLATNPRRLLPGGRDTLHLTWQQGAEKRVNAFHMRLGDIRSYVSILRIGDAGNCQAQAQLYHAGSADDPNGDPHEKARNGYVESHWAR